MKPARIQNSLDWISILIVIGMMFAVSWALVATHWTDNLNLMSLIGVLGVLAGTTLARSQFKPWLASVFASSYGLFLVVWQLGNTLDTALPWLQRLNILNSRLNVFASVIIEGKPNDDPFIFLLLMAILFWVLGIWNGWVIFRRESAWLAIPPGGIVITIFIYFYYGEESISLFLALYSFLAIFLAARMDILNRMSGWTEQRARVSIDATFRVSLTSLITTIVLVGLAWGGPAFAKSEGLADIWRSISRPFEYVKDRLSDTFNPIEGPTRVIFSEYGETLKLDAGTQPFNRQVMSVTPSLIPARGGRFFWRSRVYDYYENGQWEVASGTMESFDPRENEYSLRFLSGREPVEVNIAPKGGAIKQLYLPSQPVWVDRSAQVEVIRYDDKLVDVLSFEAENYLFEGESYRTIASIASPAVEELRSAVSEYPAGILERYLQLPETITLRTRFLAEDITRDSDSNYDKTVAVTRWLRSNVEYSRVTEPPPSNRDPIDWFLFDYKVGFCNYYASAEVILLRSLGIPARLAAGYAHGQYTPEEGTYEVYAEDAHAWPEVYFPGYGWVEFEPTVSQQALNRPLLSRLQALWDEQFNRIDGLEPEADALDALDSGGVFDDLSHLEESAQVLAQARARRRIVRVTSIIFVVGIMLLFSWVRINPATWMIAKGQFAQIANRLRIKIPEPLEDQRWEWNSATGHIYSTWSAWLRRLGLSQGPWETPLERIDTFSLAMPQSIDAAQVLVNAYILERFAGEAPRIKEVRKAWRGMQVQLWLTWLRILWTRWI